MIRQKNKTGILFIPVALYAILYFFVVKIRPLILHDRNSSIMLLSIAYCLLGCTGIYLFRDDLRNGISKWKEHSLKNLLWFIGGYIADLILTNISYYPQFALYPDYEGINDNSISTAAKLVSPVLFITATGILGPVTEEIVFRFILVDKLKIKLPTIICVLLSSILFMVWHMQAFTLPELLINLPKFSTGLVYSIVMLRSKNPTVPILLHVLNNAPTMLMLLLSGTV